MISYEMMFENGKLVLNEKFLLTEKSRTFYDKSAIEKLELIMDGVMKDAKKKINGNDCKFINEERKIEIEFKNYQEIIRCLKKYEKERRKLVKRIAIGTAIGITIGAFTALFLKETLEKPKSDIKIEMMAQPKRIVINEEPIVIEKSEKETIEVLNFEETSEKIEPKIEELVDENEKEKEETIVYIDSYANYDEGLEKNVSEYDDIIKEVGEKWGVDPNLMRDIMKRESHGGTIKNKTQIQFYSWEDQIITCHNFRENKDMKIVLTNQPEKYNSDIYTITEEEFLNPYTNISVGTLIMSYLYRSCHYNLPYAVKAYNVGRGAAANTVIAAAKEQGISEEEIYMDETNLSFLKYTDVYRGGDDEYVTKVFAYSTPKFNLDDGKKYTMKYIDENGNIIEKTTTFKSSYNLLKNM